MRNYIVCCSLFNNFNLPVFLVFPFQKVSCNQSDHLKLHDFLLTSSLSKENKSFCKQASNPSPHIWKTPCLWVRALSWWRWLMLRQCRVCTHCEVWCSAPSMHGDLPWTGILCPAQSNWIQGWRTVFCSPVRRQSLFLSTEILHLDSWLLKHWTFNVVWPFSSLWSRIHFSAK